MLKTYTLKKLKKNTTILLLLFLITKIHSQTKPNILYIMSDDHTTTAIGAYGGRLASLDPTPTLDKIAAEGMVLENTFCNNAICSPSRATILTGQYSAVNGVTSLGGKIDKKRQYLPIEMRNAGYQTGVIGKWHLGILPLAFDYYKVMHSQGHYFNPIFTEKDKPIKDFDLGKKSEKGSVQMMGHSSDMIANSGIDWLQKRDKQKPFFLKLHFKAPHGNYDYAPRYEDYLADVTIPEPDNLRNRKNNGSIATRGHNDELIHRIGSSVSSRNTERYNSQVHKGTVLAGKKTSTSQNYQRFLKKYLRCVKGVDDNIARVIAHLKKEGIYDNTIIIYTSDQGYYLGEHDFFDKRWAYEEGMRMPFIIRYPKTIKKGSRNKATIENVDFAPTLIDFAGGTIPSVMQGNSFKSIVETGKTPKNWDNAAYYHYPLHMAHHKIPAHIGIRTEHYKLLMFYGTLEKKDIPDTPPGWELYDLKKDPTEDNNVYDNPSYQKVVAALKVKLKKLRMDYKVNGPQFPYNKVIDAYWDYSEEDMAKAVVISHEFLKSDLYTKKEKNLKKSKMKKKKERKKA